MAMPHLDRPPAPDWWEQQVFNLMRRESALAAEEQWLHEEQTMRFPSRSELRERDYQQQETVLVEQSQDRQRRARFGNALWVLTGKGRPPLTQIGETINRDREIAALRRTFHTLHERDAQWLERQASVLRLKRSQLETDKQSLRGLAQEFGVSVNI